MFLEEGSGEVQPVEHEDLAVQPFDLYNEALLSHLDRSSCTAGV
ncbi:MAG TPA: hypothetical protein VGJ86_01405 [Acidimicrobiales bacterium]